MSLVLAVFALVLFIIAAVWNPQPTPWFGRLVAAGLAFLTAALFFSQLHI